MIVQPRASSGAGMAPLGAAPVQLTGLSEAPQGLPQPDGPQIWNEGSTAQPGTVASAPDEIPAGAWQVRVLLWTARELEPLPQPATSASRRNGMLKLADEHIELR
jgi:hypothetical protein